MPKNAICVFTKLEAQDRDFRRYFHQKAIGSYSFYGLKTLNRFDKDMFQYECIEGLQLSTKLMMVAAKKVLILFFSNDFQKLLKVIKIVCTIS